MDVTFKRTGERRYGVYVERPGHPPVEMNPAPSYDEDLPHDFVHFVVEEELGLQLGVFGQLAIGGNAGTFRLVQEGAASREASRARRRHQERGKHLSEDGHDEADLSERAATLCHHEWLRRYPNSARLAKARELEPFVKRVREGSDPAELEALSEPVLGRICERLEALSERWSRLEPGQSLTLRWSPGSRPRDHR